MMITGQAQSAWPYLFQTWKDDMPQTHSRSREKAELAFTKIQSQFLARSAPAPRRDDAEDARNLKNARLREARLARDRNTDRI
jgi:hypothetical protein